MPISITEKSRDFLESIVMDKWNSIDWKNDYIYGVSVKVITLCKELGMYHLAEQLENDKKAA